jgi:hypothetical protein
LQPAAEEFIRDYPQVILAVYMGGGISGTILQRATPAAVPVVGSPAWQLLIRPGPITPSSAELLNAAVPLPKRGRATASSAGTFLLLYSENDSDPDKRLCPDLQARPRLWRKPTLWVTITH